jgi:ATP synthase protein I
MQSNDARIIRGAAIFAAAAGALAVVIGAVAAGTDGALGVALGAVLAVAFFGLGQLALVQAGRRWPELLLGLGLLVYTTQIGVLLGLLFLLGDATFLSGGAFAAGVLVGVVGWLTGQIWAGLRLKTPYVEPQPSTPRSTSAGPGGRP